MPGTIFFAGAISGLLAVLLGAFGAHALKAQLSSNMLEVYQTAVQYHFYHTLAIFIIGMLASKVQSSVLLNWSAALMVAGLLLFCGSLYLLAITGHRWLGMITPLGGVSFVAAWLLLAVSVWQSKSQL